MPTQSDSPVFRTHIEVGEINDAVTFVRIVTVVVQRITGSLAIHFRDKPIESPMPTETVTQKRFGVELEIGIITETAQILSHTLYHLPDLFGI